MPPEGAKLYLAPPAREPLTDEQIRALVQPMDWPPSVTEIVRAGEHWCDRKAAGIDPEAAEDCYTAMLAAAPTPPVVLPPLPLTKSEYGFNYTPAFTADQMHDYARAALAQYGIKEQSDETHDDGA